MEPIPSGHPGMIVPVGHVEPVPRRIRGFVAGRPVFDTVRARYVWLWPGYPQYCVPYEDVADGALADEGRDDNLEVGQGRRHTLRLGALSRPGAAWRWGDDAPSGVTGHVTFRWEAVDAWFEEDEEVFVHPRSPYTRVDALRSGRPVRVTLDGVVLADAPSSVMVFETGLPTRYYLDRVHLDWTRLHPTATVTNCPYKGRTTGYWSVTTDRGTYPDLAWSYDFPTRQLSPVAGLVAFYNEHVDIDLDGHRVPRPEPVRRPPG
ncbi:MULTISPECIES: DUF427 domain-containing protein [Streptomycetaceae]|uniref:DUF427 domain-containing protein n=1 Tax=Streptantibioticus cattleyicolor (strain ATCC 35852 / DSM 46488 / JCM 4925 / NBRC 14057 / NRRL 8057) TaxID=1003195 RepID=F8K0F9_STREN|nr:MULTISPECIES: DUF427 domain-containing protein [Streptomycetaceae]AEW97363.1 hypothetical protein SCATT_49920 [Streptantibioticus cattleyicolor NRRL 8057 = DSM 46488]MYS61813.1 DUF427 domain-containing protein [Streptomyces sp. SID5468]CCB77686.1 conserved protein of unknown function [Streptantibioticus cattleyicolor NRRL 8057 = DSM 46488]